MIALAPPLLGILTVTPQGYYGAMRPKRHGVHVGLDFRAQVGTAVYSATSGRVARTGWDPPVSEGGGGGGNFVIVQSRDDAGELYEIGYMHLTEVLVNSGQPVATGDQLGTAGETGTDGGPHLHFQVKAVSGSIKQPVDPTALFSLTTERGDGKKGLTLGGAVLLMVAAAVGYECAS